MTRLRCRFCGQRLDPERALIRDYCIADPCQARGLKPLKVVAVPVHKSIPMLMPQYVPGEHLDARRNR